MSDLWSFIRNVLTQGHAQQMDYDAGKYPGGYEEFCAHFEDAARDRVEELEAIIARRPLPAEQPGDQHDSTKEKPE